MKLEAFLVLAISTSAEPDIGTEMFCPFVGQKVPAGSITCTKWMQCGANRFGIVQECPNGLMFNKNTRECDETCTPDVCCLNPDTYVPPTTIQASTTASTVTSTQVSISSTTTQDQSCKNRIRSLLKSGFLLKKKRKIQIVSILSDF